MVKISVVTICFNAEETIENTMKSVVDQTYGDIEYIIVDGASGDSTLSIINKLQREIENGNTNKNIEMIVISEKDKGIYDAMNKGIDLATGEWVLFMNSGDTFHHNTVIEEVFPKEYGKEVDGIFGDTQRVGEGFKKVYKAKPLSEIKHGFPLPFCHQSVFVRSELLKQRKFDLTYKQAADYDMFVHFCMENKNFIHVNVIVSNYALGGISQTFTVFHLKEKIRIREQYRLERFSRFKRITLIKTLEWKQKIKKIVPKIILNKIRLRGNEMYDSN